MHDFDILEWDSREFGFKVASIRQSTHSLASLSDCLNVLRRERVELAYWFADDDPALTRIAEQCRGKLVDRKVTYTVDLTSLPTPTSSRPVQIQDARGADLAALESLAIQSGQYSRFARDPRFPRDRFELLYREWIKKSLDRILADRVLVWREDDGMPLGMSTVGVAQNRASIGLFAVDTQSRGRGIGRHLVQAAQSYAVERGAAHCDVVTQQENLAACRLYEGCGFRVRSVLLVHHFWLADAS